MQESWKQELEQDREIEPYQLDVEAVTQAALFSKWADRYITAKIAAEREEWLAEVEDSSLQLRIRENPATYGLHTSCTEAAVKAAVKLQGSWQTAHEKAFRARETAGWLEYAVKALDMKKRMLEELVALHGQNYFAGPKVPRDIVQAYKSARQQGEERTTERQKAVARKRVRLEKT